MKRAGFVTSCFYRWTIIRAICMENLLQRFGHQFRNDGKVILGAG